jgi:DNA polymerase
LRNPLLARDETAGEMPAESALAAGAEPESEPTLVAAASFIRQTGLQAVSEAAAPAVAAEAVSASAPVAAPASAPISVPISAPMAAPVPAPARPVPERPAAMPLMQADDAEADTNADTSTAWFDDAPTPPRAAPVSDAAIAAMDWQALKTAIAGCTRCDLCSVRRNAVSGRGAENASWLAIAAAPSRLDEKENRAIAGDAGLLLDNMLKAIALAPESDVYVTSLVKCRPSGPDGAERAPAPDELSACRPFLDRELALTGATMLMTFGQHAARGLLSAAQAPATRGKVHRYGALPVVATYHPDDLLRRPEDKAKAWGDLCLAKAARD